MRLIDAYALDKRLEETRNDYPGDRYFDNYVYGFDDAWKLVKEAPIIEAEPVRHGKWEEYQIPHIICCSECDYGTCVDEKTKFCPNCGAKMDFEIKEGKRWKKSMRKKRNPRRRSI